MNTRILVALIITFAIVGLTGAVAAFEYDEHGSIITPCWGDSFKNVYAVASANLSCDPSQPIDQSDAEWQQVAIPVNLDGGWKTDVIANHDWSDPEKSIFDALDEAQANQVPHYIYSKELYPAEIAIYDSELLRKIFYGIDRGTRDTSQPIDQSDAEWQQVAIPVNLDGGWKTDVIANHDWSDPEKSIFDALDEAQANQVPHYIYSKELYPAEIAIYDSELLRKIFYGIDT